MRLPKCFVEEFENIPEHVDRLIYVRDEHRSKIGVVIIHNGACGWSLCNDTDQWDTFSGILVAWERLLEGRGSESIRFDCANKVDSYVDNNQKHYLKMNFLYMLLYDYCLRYINKQDKLK